MKGAGSLGEPRDRKHATGGSAQRVPREPSEPGAFEALLSMSVSSGSEPGAFWAVLVSVSSGSEPGAFWAVLVSVSSGPNRKRAHAQRLHAA